MPWTATLYLFFVFTASAIALVLFFYAWRHRTKPGATALALLMLAFGQWSLSVGALSVSRTESAGEFWHSFEFIGVSFGSVLLLVFAIQYSNVRWITRKRLLLLFVIPMLSQVLIWTNEVHHLFFRSIRIAPTQEGLMSWELDPGIGFWLHTAYSYLCALGAFLLIVRLIARSFFLYRRQALALLFGLIPVIVASVLDTLGGLSGPQQELTPIGFVFMGLAFSLAFFRYRLLDVVPIAREQLIDSMSDGMLVLDEQDRIVDLNPAARSIFHLSPEEGIGQSAQELLHDWFPKIIEVCRDETQDMLCEIVMPQGLEEKHYDVKMSVLRNRREQANGRLLILRDISDRKRIEKMLLKLQQAVETTEVGVTITDVDGTIEYSNPAEALIHGYRVEELLGRSANMFAAPEFRQPKATGRRHAHVYSQWTRERTNIRKDGSSFPVKLISNPIYDNTGLHVGTVTVCEDISRRKQAEAKLLAAHTELQEKNIQLHELNASKDKFFSIISHDLRSPFNTLLGFSEILLEQFEQNSLEKNRRYLENLYRSADRLHALLDNLLTWARLQRGAMKYAPECIDLGILVNSIFELFSPKAEQKEIELRQTLLPGTQVFADLDMLNTVLRNLVSNALKFTTAGDTVEISAGKHDEQSLEIAVTDTGSGIHPEQRDTLFLPDTHCTTTGTAGEQGTGLGLILCRELVERHEGILWVDSEIGRGTTFRFTLPEGRVRRCADDAV